VPYGYNEGRPVQSLDCDGIVSGLDVAAQRLRDLQIPKVSSRVSD